MIEGDRKAVSAPRPAPPRAGLRPSTNHPPGPTRWRPLRWFRAGHVYARPCRAIAVYCTARFFIPRESVTAGAEFATDVRSGTSSPAQELNACAFDALPNDRAWHRLRENVA